MIEIALTADRAAPEANDVELAPQLALEVSADDALDAAPSALEGAQLERYTKGVRWLTAITKDSEGQPITVSRPQPCQANVVTALAWHPAWAGVIGFNEFTGDVVTLKAPPMRAQDRPKGAFVPGVWTEEDTTRAQSWCAVNLGFEPAPGQVIAAVKLAAHKNPFHPVRDWLNGLAWDGTPRIDTWLNVYLGVTKGEQLYVSAVGSKFLVGLVARVMVPGCKLDTTLVLEGPQGGKKSTSLRKLVGEKWFADTKLDFGDKDAMQALRGKWLIELAELVSVTSAKAVTQMKAFLSSGVDYYRPSYARTTRDFPRQCVFAGSTNEDQYLEDQTGNRRFWPVACGILDVQALERDREQLFAEAVTRYRAGGEWWLTPEEEGAAVDEQDARTEEDPWESMIQDWLMCPMVPQGDAASRAVDLVKGFTTADVLLGAIRLSPAQCNRAAQTRVGAILKNYDFERRGKPLTYRAKPAPLPTSQHVSTAVAA